MGELAYAERPASGEPDGHAIDDRAIGQAIQLLAETL
jgi:hypothetical protein